jgi:DNA-directed RNA polymerase II subunit RPB1
MPVSEHMLTPQSNKPSMGIVQDALHGSRVLTRKDIFLERHQVMQMLGFTHAWGGRELPLPCILKPKMLWSGKQVFSCILPKLNHKSKTNHYTPPDDNYELFGKVRPDLSPTDTRVVMRNGQILIGNMCKKTLGTSPNSLIQIIFSDYGPIITRNFVDDVQSVAGEFLTTYATTISVGDMQAPPDIEERMDRIEQIADENIEKWRRSKMPMREFESKVNKTLNDARNEAASDTMKYLNYKNGFYSIVTSGSKGSKIHPAQITRCVGQQNIGGERIPQGWKNRSLSHFKQFDMSSRAGGFIRSSYFRGLKPHEVWYHAMASREGLNDTAVKTCETGYLQRRMCKGMEDNALHYDMTVRNSSGSVVQFAYGEDGFDGMWQEWQNLDLIKITDHKFSELYEWENVNYATNDAKNDEELLLKLERRRLIRDRILIQELQDNGIVQPVNIRRFMKNFPYDNETDELITRDQVVLDVIEVQKKLLTMLPEGAEKWDNNFFILLRSNLSSKKVCKLRKTGRKNWYWLMSIIVKKLARAIANPGDNVGTLASQSIGEPATQMTLDTFHFGTCF